MAEIKYTKNALRGQEQKLKQLQSYLPTLQLKKKLLQFEVMMSHSRLENLFSNFQRKRNDVDKFSQLLSDMDNGNILEFLEIEHVNKIYENIAGLEAPIFERVVFKTNNYSLFDTPVWMDRALYNLRELIEIKQNMNVEEERKRALMKELREVSIRVNLFEKILIPRTLTNIKKIKIFLGDQALAAVAQTKVAKKKISRREA
jgi:V/A-type H+-transporting ATPase subunit D